MAKNLKLNIKNTQIAKALNLDSLKDKLAKKKAGGKEKEPAEQKPVPKSTKTKADKAKAGKGAAEEHVDLPEKEEAPKIKARSRSVFAEPEKKEEPVEQETPVEEPAEPEEELSLESKIFKDAEEVREESFAEEKEPTPPVVEELSIEAEPIVEETAKEEEAKTAAPKPAEPEVKAPVQEPVAQPPKPVTPPPVKLGPTGRHVKDLLVNRWAKPSPDKKAGEKPKEQVAARDDKKGKPEADERFKPKPKSSDTPATSEEDADDKSGKKKGVKPGKFKEYKDIKPAKRGDAGSFDYRARQGLRDDDEGSYRKRRPRHGKEKQEEVLISRPTSIKIRTPISIKDLAGEMKLKASQLIEKLFMQGLMVTLNDVLEDEITIQLLGHEFGCEIALDNTEKERVRITDKTIKEEVMGADPDKLESRAPIVAFMGHVDHGKTSLIDSIRKSNRVAGEAGAITQHIGAFRCKTKVGDITVLDTPGHEAFSAMRARGADVTDIVVLVVAGDEGMKQQTVEALNHAKSAGVTIVVAINKCDKPAFNPETVYRQLAEHELVPEAWGGQTITVNCSAVTGQGVEELLEMLALQSEVLELKADPTARARGIVLESEMHKGLGAKATVLVLNGTLKPGDAIVFGSNFGRVKTMHDERGHNMKSAGPSSPAEITGLSGLPDAGEEFIVVKDEKEAKSIADIRAKDERLLAMQRKAVSLEKLLEGASNKMQKKVLNVILRADVQGSLEALKTALMKIESTKVSVNIIFSGVGEISESDVLLANASNAVIIGFHTLIESHAEPLIKQWGIKVAMHDIIYHAIDSVKLMMEGLLDKLAIETDRGVVEVKAVFKSSQHGQIAGCQVIDGSVHRNWHVRLMREGKEIWRGPITSLKRHKDDVKEVSKGFECGVLLPTNDIKEGDKLEIYEVTYQKQEL
ncbi:translation initiation factor IF-2 [Estrella lausannensis]|uniref:Translation initiation factor IF-2 n=1 Tax=Estrella lausannensis TaxID=483423 RepID=A0A0H5DSL7_9BACT|nr:translation initiation factor IF-2 [Estrella lausannensis]CRX39303.1 Translation initiation factor IF-2 [Estrella lausannensis]